MKNLHYSPSEQILFWIAGYTADDNTPLVLEKIKCLTKDAKTFSKVAKCKLSEVMTYYNTMPPRFQHMRMFYVKTDYIPEGTFNIRKDNTMFNFIST